MILVVTGSRKLHEDPGRHRPWITALVRSHLDFGDELWQGGAVGPDRWAAEAARDACVRVVTFLPDGRVFDSNDGLAPSWWSDRRMERPNPLARNREMIRAAAGMSAAEPLSTARLLAFTCEGARTHGTEYTIARAVEYGLPLEVFRYAAGAWTDDSARWRVNG